MVFGAYPFASSKPWLKLSQNEKVVNISEAELENITKSYLQNILQHQAQSDSLKLIRVK